jgi:hypothetical protein
LEQAFTIASETWTVNTEQHSRNQKPTPKQPGHEGNTKETKIKTAGSSGLKSLQHEKNLPDSSTDGGMDVKKS